jgi:hypothetical protein
MNIQITGHKIASGPASPLLKRMGFAGFSFFFIKGMLWLLIPLIAQAAIL